MTTGLMLLVLLFAAPLVLLVMGFGVMVAAAHVRNWLARPRGPELIVPSWRVTEAQARRVIVEGDDLAACAEDDRRAVAALLAEDRANVARLRREAARSKVIQHGNAAEGSEGSKTVVERVPDPSDHTAQAEAVALLRQYLLPARRDRRGR